MLKHAILSTSNTGEAAILEIKGSIDVSTTSMNHDDKNDIHIKTTTP